MGKKPGPLPGRRQSSKAAIIERRRTVAAMVREGRSQFEISQICKVTQATISGDIAVLAREWMDDASKDFDQRKAEEIMRVNAVEVAATKAWERSCTCYVYQKQGKKTIKVKVDKNGDPRFLKQIMEAVELRCKILGVIKNVGDTRINNLQTMAIDYAEMFTHMTKEELDAQDSAKILIEGVQNGTFARNTEIPFNNEQMVNRLPSSNGNGTH